LGPDFVIYVGAVLAVAVAVVVLRHLEHSWARVLAFFATGALCFEAFFFTEGWRVEGANLTDVLRALLAPLVIGLVLGVLASLRDRRLAGVVVSAAAVAMALSLTLGAFVVWLVPYDA
jgi:hypothetical protein